MAEEQKELPGIPATGKVLYRTKTAPGFKVYIGNDLVEAVGGVLTCTPAQAAELDELMKTRGDIRAHVEKIDRDAALKAAEEFKKTLKPQMAAGAASTADFALNEHKQSGQAEILTGKVDGSIPGVNNPGGGEKKTVQSLGGKKN